MRRLVTALLACAALALPLGVASGSSALAAPHRAHISQRQLGRPAGAAPHQRLARAGIFWCDGDGFGSCMSLIPGGCDTCDESALFAYGKTAGAWTWVEEPGPTVGTGNYIFKDQSIESALAGQPTETFRLWAAQNDDCAANLDGGAVIRFSNLGCSLDKAQTWVYDLKTDWLVNMGRSNDEDNWEILCNPGGGGQLTVTTRDSCSTYHSQWAIAG